MNVPVLELSINHSLIWNKTNGRVSIGKCHLSSFLYFGYIMQTLVPNFVTDFPPLFSFYDLSEIFEMKIFINIGISIRKYSKNLYEKYTIFI